MNYKFLITIVFSFLTNEITSQTHDIINPRGNWYFGAEVGGNIINSYSNPGDTKRFIQGGLLSEYYFAKSWSLSVRVKYFDIGESFYQPNTKGGFISFGSEERYGTFNGAVIAIPINIKWEFRIYRNLKGSLKLGYVYNFETKSDYINYSENMDTDYPKNYGSGNQGIGLNYFINKNIAIYSDFEYYHGTTKGYRNDLFGPVYYNTSNYLINFGVKYNFKKHEKTE